MDKWISVADRLPTDGTERENSGPHIHCWCAVAGYGTEHLSWNPFHQCWDQDDEDDISCFNRLVTHWLPLPAPPEVN